MTLHLYFLRHGKAFSRSEWTGDDDLRPLTEDGERVMRAEALVMRQRGLAPDVIVTSPLARARRTAEIVADGLDLRERLVDDARLAHGFDARGLAKIMSAHAGAGEVMVVGHEPDFSATVAELIGGGRVDMKKGGLARVDVRGPDLDGGVLVWLLTPAQLTGE
jgi:phosphohistidine phosphatase